MRAWRCELPISPISKVIVLISQIFLNVCFVIRGLDILLSPSQFMPNGSREVQERMPEQDAERIFHSLVHRSGMISRGSYLDAGPNQTFGAITMPSFISAPSHAPHQPYELFAMI